VDSLFAWIETTSAARATAESLALTAALSAIHVLGFTLVMGSALLANLKRLGALLPQCSVAEVLRPANRAILVGLAISVTTGALLFAARATAVSANGTFQLKMLLLLAAAAFHFAVGRNDYVQGSRVAPRARAGAAVSLALWFALAVTACAFILLE
jgi:uncharacterized protein YacL